MTILIRGGTIIDAERTYRADVLCADPKEGGTILQIGLDLDVPAGTETIDASGQYVMPGGIDPHTQHGAAVHGNDSERRLLYRHGSGVGRRYDEHYRFCYSKSEATVDGSLQRMARLGGKGVGGLWFSRGRDVVGRVGVQGHGNARA